MPGLNGAFKRRGGLVLYTAIFSDFASPEIKILHKFMISLP